MFSVGGYQKERNWRKCLYCKEKNDESYQVLYFRDCCRKTYFLHDKETCNIHKKSFYDPCYGCKKSMRRKKIENILYTFLCTSVFTVVAFIVGEVLLPNSGHVYKLFGGIFSIWIISMIISVIVGYYIWHKQVIYGNEIKDD